VAGRSPTLGALLAQKGWIMGTVYYLVCVFVVAVVVTLLLVQIIGMDEEDGR
jgi:mannose/fructose/N-acetylgalactosamine-specific phosphotransferase system component IID